MKIRTLLILSYLTIIFGLGGGFYFFIRIINKELTTHNIKAASTGIHEIASNNYNLSTKVLTEIGQAVVAIKANAASYRLADLLEEIPQPYNYSELTSNSHLRAIATASVYSYGGESGYIDIYDTNGFSIWHPNDQIQGKSYKLWEEEYPDMWRLTKESFTKSFVTGYYTFVSKEGAEERKFMASVHITNTPFVVCASVYINDYFLPVQELIRDSEEAITNKVYSEILKAAEKNEVKWKKIGAAAFLLLSIIGVIVGLWFARTISSPIRDLSKAVQKIANGDFSIKVKQKGPPEIVRLAASFNTLGDELTDYMDNLKKEVAVRETYQREIDIAREIQQSLLPRIFPPFPEHNEFSLYAGVQPAKEVAGDFFDFFFSDEDTLTLIIGDVSGKSVPAAFFMAVSRTLLRTVCGHGMDLDKAIEYANNILCEDNDTCMFVTLFVANFNVKTGEVIYCNAGHHEACNLISNDDVEQFGISGSPALGAIPNVAFNTGTYKLETGNKLVLYTDGVTEAHSPDKELFGEERLFEILKREADKSPEELYDIIIKELNDFQAGENFDDVTLLILERCRAGILND
ncbi:SpoIIE family protein phosphatase [bacterium]|nr:SpoIIE family protein phosphatase [bacterium]